LALVVAGCLDAGVLSPDLPRPEPTPEPSPTPEPPTTPPLCHVELECGQAIPDEPKIPCQLLVEERDGALQYQGWAGVERRGRSSLGFPKPHLGVELWAGPEESPIGVNLFEMGRESDWILNGNYADRALFRNKLSFDAYQEFGGLDRYATETVLCELTLDGTWLGVFTLGERLKRDDDRLVLQDDPDGRTFLVKSDDGGGGLLASPSTYGEWFLVWPRADEASPEQLDGIRDLLQGMEDAAFYPDPGEPDTGVFAHIDLDSAVDWVLIQEISKNNDAYFLSVYLWKDIDGLIHLAPWDHDLAWGGYPVDYCGPEGWVRFRPRLFQTMAESAAFRERLAERWLELRQGPLATERLLARVHLYRDVIEEAAWHNFEVWPMEDIHFTWDNTNWLCPVSTWGEEMIDLERWVEDRVEWLDDHIHEYGPDPP